ncbi:MAG: ABC transporter ATP-binding protein, partial [Ruminococcus sp.]|nr:ABC transporter ATP-binding protein [Ruminococcus sp.]
MDTALNIKGITKKYKDFTLGGIDINIPKGFSSALIGANGAGKTTLIDIICGVTASDAGNMEYFGKYTDNDRSELRNMIGYCSSANFFPMDWNLKKVAEVMEVAFDGFDRKKFSALCDKFKLGDPFGKKQKKLMKMSDGNRMRAYLAAVLARNTELLVLDEPASSLDPLARDLLCDMFRDYLAERDGERTVIFSTHNIADMEFVTDNAIFMAGGKVIEQGFVEDLKEKYILVHGDAAVS